MLVIELSPFIETLARREHLKPLPAFVKKKISEVFGRRDEGEKERIERLM